MGAGGSGRPPGAPTRGATPHPGERGPWGVPVFWLRTNGVNTSGAAAKVMNFDRLGKKYDLAFWGKNIRLTGIPQKSLCQKT